MEKYITIFKVSENQRKRVQRALCPKTLEDLLGRDETISVTARFPDGNEMDIKCCGCSYDEEVPVEELAAWCEAVLFNKNGSELCCSEPSDGFFGEWHLEYNGVEYIVDIV